MKPLFKSKISLWTSILALMVVIGIGATLALMASPSNSVTNSFSAADVNTQVDEVLTNGDKQVRIANTGPSDAYVRARIMISGVRGEWNGANDDFIQGDIQVQVVSSENEATEKDKVYLVMPNCVDDSVSDISNKWFFVPNNGPDVNNESGFFYYGSVLKAPGQGQTKISTEPLLEKVIIGEDLLKDEDFLHNFSVTIYHESVLAINQSLIGEAESDSNIILSSFRAAMPETTPEPTP